MLHSTKIKHASAQHGKVPEYGLIDANSNNTISTAVCHQGRATGSREQSWTEFPTGFVRPCSSQTHLINGG